ncbi:hypothetical protein AB6A40_007593 [Gnathostoma spinigerum]|uniref:Protein kinase domain-containing protein n=1 Tax=Gnathostoma spinigerum TaxID=75299 RepID=A0ABD6EUC4_9BILA
MAEASLSLSTGNTLPRHIHPSSSPPPPEPRVHFQLSSSSATPSPTFPVLSSSSSTFTLVEGHPSQQRPENPLSRKRIAARRLPRIGFGHTGSRSSSDDEPSPSVATSSTSGLSNDSLLNETIDLKRFRVSDPSQLIGQFSLSEFGDGQPRSSFGSSDGEEVSKVYRKFPDVNNVIVGGYKLVGCGREFNAYHTETNTVKTCQLITNDQYRKAQQIRERLNHAAKWWKYEDVNEMKEFVLPSDTEFYRDDYSRLFMISPMQYGTVHSQVQSRKTSISEADIQPIFAQIVRGVAFCHSLGIVVRDLKPRKFVYVDRAMARIRLYDVFDLFLCEDVSRDGMRDRHSCPAYVSPEILKKGPVEYAGRPADIWALGVLLYVLLIGRYPFYDKTPQGVFFKILKGRFCIPVSVMLSKSARLLIFGMLKKEPSERPSAEQLLHTPWLCIDKAKLPTSPTSLLSGASLSAAVLPTQSSYAYLLPRWRPASSIGILSPALHLFEQLLRSGDGMADDQVVPSAASENSWAEQMSYVKAAFGLAAGFTVDLNERELFVASNSRRSPSPISSALQSGGS